MKTREQICDAFFTIEKEQNFFNIKINNVNIWNNVRYYVYTIIMTRIGLLTDDTMSGVMIQHKRQPFLKVLKQLIDAGGIGEMKKYLPFFGQKKDLLCVLFPVRRNNGEFDEEIYVDKYYSQIKKYTYYALEWGPEIGERSANPQTKNLKYTCDDVILAWFGKREDIHYKKIYREFNRLILKKLECSLEICFTEEERRKIYREIYLNYYKRNAYIRYYQFIFKQIRPKAILYYNGAEYYTQLLVETGKMCNIKTVEIQHGLFGLDSSYRCLPEQGVPTVPDYFLTYGEMVNDLLESDNIKPICIGRPDIFQKAGQFHKKHKNNVGKKTLLFVSSCDGTVEYLGRVWDKIDYAKYRVILKLHPIEQAGWRKKYPFLMDANEIKVVTKSDRDIYYWINRADYMIGNWSTAFYEALPFPIVKILVADVTPYTHIMIEKGYVLYITKDKKLMDVIEQVEKGEILIKSFEKDDYIMYSQPINRMDSVIKEIIT